MPDREFYYIDFNVGYVKDKIKATRISLKSIMVTNLDQRLPVDLKDHSLYKQLYNYCIRNPPKD